MATIILTFISINFLFFIYITILEFLNFAKKKEKKICVLSRRCLNENVTLLDHDILFNVRKI